MIRIRYIRIFAALLSDMQPQMIDRLKKGDATAYRQLFDDHYIRLTAFALRIVQDENLAKDIVQNVFLRIFQNREELSIHSNLKSYLYRAVSNECINEQKGKARRSEHHFQYTVTLSDADLGQAREENEREYRVYKAIDQLPPKCREIVLMRMEGKKNAEIAEKLNISARTVETQISNAIKSLRQSARALYCLIFPFFKKN